VNRAARIRAIAHREQILISGVTAGIVRGALPNESSLIDLGQHRLRDVAEMEHIFQLAHPELRADFPRYWLHPRTMKALLTDGNARIMPSL
jgi:class 3 adenylate cyclase